MMPRIYDMPDKMFRLRNQLIWSLSLDGYDGQEIGYLLYLDKSSVNRIIQEKPKGFVSMLNPVSK